MMNSYGTALFAGMLANSTEQSMPRKGVECRFQLLAVAVLTFLSLLTPGSITAQVERGTITGLVTDTGGAVVTGAVVTVSQRDTGLSLHGQTSGDGMYVFPQLQPGQYSVVVEKQGFKRAETSVTLTVGQVALVDMQLVPGSVTEVVNVEAASAAQLDTQSSTLDYTVGPQQLGDLPLNGRNAYGLAALTPGIAPGAYFGQGLSTTRGAVVAAATNNFETNGGIAGSNEVLLDGISIVVCCQGQPAVTPTLEVLGEFKVVTSNPPAEYGHSSGGILNVATKSGTNHLHGDVYEYFRNDALDAANYFTKASGVYPFPGRNDYTLPHRFNQFGAFVSGPVVLPHVYHGKDRTFFTFGYEGTRNFAPTFQTVTVPTALMREGIFTEAPTLIYDPNSYNPTTGLRTPIPAACNGSTCYPAGEYIPATSVNPVAQKMLALIPAPNAPGVSNNYNYTSNVNDTENQYNFRIDHDFSDQQRTFLRFTRDSDTHHVNDVFNQPSGPNGARYQNLIADLFALGHVWTVSPSLLLQFSYGFAYQSNTSITANYYGPKAVDYGFSSLFASQEQIPGLPQIYWSGLQSFGTAVGGTIDWVHYVHSLNATAIWQRGKHTLTAGYSGSMILENEPATDDPTATFNFDSTFTNGPNPNAPVDSGQVGFNAWADWMLGYPGSGQITINDTLAFNQFYNAVFLQDSWRVNPKLTLNLGVRVDIEDGLKERFNRFADFGPNIANPLSAYTGLSFTGGAQYLGVAANPSRTWLTSTKVGPRVGFAYAVAQSTVVRGGYGILYLPTTQRTFGDSTLGFAANTNMLATVSGFTPVNTIDNPFPSGVSQPAGPASGVAVGAGSSVAALVYNNPVSYQQQWNFGVERGLTKGLVFTLNYVGGHGVKLPQPLSPNDLNPKYFGAPGDQTQVAYLQAQVNNPFYGSSLVTPGSYLASPTVERANLLAAFPQYGPNTSMSNQSVTYGYIGYDSGSASYNAMQATFLVAHSHGLNASVAYTWSKLLGNISDWTTGFLNPTGNPAIQDTYLINQYERSNLPTDVPQRVVGHIVYALPVGRGKTFGENMAPWADKIVGGWTLTSIFALQSGFPLGLNQAGGEPFSGSRPSYVPGVNPVTSGSNYQRLNDYLNPAAFRLAQSFELGDVPSSAGALRSPRTFQDDVSAIKNFAIFENLRGEFRVEAFNFLNKVQFGLPGTTFGASNFGQISSQANLPRNVQLALKIFF